MSSPAPPRRPLPRAVIALGWVSLLTDAASDMIYPLVPAFLITLGGGAEALGWVEGVAEAVAAVVKIFAGRLSDRAARKKPLIAAGYGLSALARPLFAVATSPIQAVFVRSLDRVGKGLRGPPRDLVLAASVGAENRGAAFGFHRMMDNFGGVLGPLIAFTLLRAVDLPLRTVFAASLVPGLLAVVVILVFVREPPPRLDPEKAPAPEAIDPPPKLAPLPPAARRYLAVVGLFSLAGSGDLFLLNRMTDLGMDRALVPVAWVSLQLGKGLLNVAGGRASDQFGRRPVLVIAWVLYAVSYAGFGLVGSWPAAWGVLAIYAFHYGFAEGGQRALLAELVPSAARGRAFGIQLAIEGLAVLPANVIFGLVYSRVSATAAFVGSGAIALCAAAALLTVTTTPRSVVEGDFA
jgi:MFS family permease